MNLKSIKLPPIGRILKQFFGRYHVVTFTIIVVGGLAVTSYFLNTVVASSTTTSETVVGTQAPGFDENTIDRVNELSESSGKIESLAFPDNKRTNPFTE